jgi:hypothetical protein
MELMVSFWHVIDMIIGKEKTGSHAAKLFQYLLNAAGGLYHKKQQRAWGSSGGRMLS